MPLPKLADTPRNNRILAALSDPEMEEVGPKLEHVRLETEQILWETDERGSHLYFPTTSLISLVYETDTGMSVSIATLGRSGIVGAGLIGGNVRTPDRAVVTYGGSAYRIKVAQVDNELADCGDFHKLLLAYTNSLMTKISQNAICNRLHRIDQQLSRWLLDCHDELATDSLAFTHDQIACILGVRRESISLAASQLQKGKIIKTSRGKVHISNPAQLSKTSCECYSIVREHLDKTLARYTSEHSA